jgi:hypothetical protein
MCFLKMVNLGLNAEMFAAFDVYSNCILWGSDCTVRKPTFSSQEVRNVGDVWLRASQFAFLASYKVESRIVGKLKLIVDEVGVTSPQFRVPI